jgi:all-trans-retinol dehydrogenase (NAD+)
LINNAGIVQGKSFLEMSEQEASKTMVVNAESHFWTTKEFLPSMVERNSGHIVSVASMAGKTGNLGQTDYCASKFAAVGFMEALSLEIAGMKKKIATTLICPVYINTGMFSGVACPTQMPMLN